MTFWTAQILGLTGSLLAFTAVQTGSRRKIIGLQLVCCVLWVVQYVLLGAWTGVLINLLGLARGDLDWRCIVNPSNRPIA